MSGYKILFQIYNTSIFVGVKSSIFFFFHVFVLKTPQNFTQSKPSNLNATSII
jgi:hypothetical protein